MQQKLTIIAAVATSLFVSSCGEENTADQQAETAAPETAAPEMKVPEQAEPALNPPAMEDPKPETADADLKRGARQFLKCRSCHTLAEGGKHKTGPNLWGVFGAKTAARSDFKYSAAFASLDQTWTEETMDAFLKRPSKFAPGTIMSFAGVPKERDRKALISYLLQETSP